MNAHTKSDRQDITAYSSVMFFNWDIAAGIGPSIDVPCMSLQQVQHVLRYRRKGPIEEWKMISVDQTHSLSIRVQFPINSGNFPDIVFPSILLQTTW